MKIVNDIVLDAELDLLFVDGDFFVFDTTLQHQKLIVETNKGDWKNVPEVGVDMKNYFLNENFSGLLTEIKKQLVIDGMDVQSVSINEKAALTIKAEYK